MGWLSKLGKIALVAAPYVAAPFTGGASLMATGATNMALQKWNQKDAQKRAAQGLAPSKFDKFLGYASTGAGVASGLGAFGGLSGAAGMAGNAGKVAGAANTASKVSKFANTLNNVNKGLTIAGAAAPIVSELASRGGGGSAASDARSTSGLSPSGSAMERNGVMPRGGYNYRNNPMNQVDQSNPNLATSIFQGRQEAMNNQPFRSGYTVNNLGRDEVPYSFEQGPIYPNNERRRRVEATQ